mgnify:CR=1 FL=1
MRKNRWIHWLLLMLIVTLIVPSLPRSNVRAAELDSIVLYDDALGEQIVDHSWAEHSLTEGEIVRSGVHSIRLNPSRGGALYLYSQQYLLTREYNTLEMWMHGGQEGGQQLNLLFQLGGKTVAKIDLNDYLADGALLDGVWQKVRINLLPLRMPSGLFDGIVLQDSSHSDQGDVYLDDVRLVQESEPVPNKPPRPVQERIVVYDDELNGTFIGFPSPAENEALWKEQVSVHSGTYAIKLDPAEGTGLYIYKDRVLDVAEYPSLSFWIHGGESGGQAIDLSLKLGGEEIQAIELEDYLGEGEIKAGEWEQVTIPLGELSLPNDLLDGLEFRFRKAPEGEAAGASGGTLFLDDISLIKLTYEQPKLTGLTFAQESMLMYAGNAEAPMLTAHYDNGYEEVLAGDALEDDVSWSSTAPEIATTNAGTIEALARGSARVTAEYEGMVAEVNVQVIEVVAEKVYDDVLQEEYDDWSWGERDLHSEAAVHSGENAIEFVPRWWQGVYLNRDDSYPVEDYYGFEFWILGSGQGKQSLRFVVQDGNSILGSIVVDELLPGGVQADRWQKVTVRLDDLGIEEGFFNAIVFQAWDEKEQEPVYIDDISVLRFKDRIENPKPQVTSVSVAIDTEADRIAISPDIYGVNFEEIAPENVSGMTEYPVVRWGGNSVTRYNWKLNVQNHASDWFYMNLPKDNSEGETLPDGSRSDRFIDETLGNGGKVLLQVPTIGWTPKSREVTTGFSVAKYGPQQLTECSYGGWWCNPDAGNGIRPDGSLITGNDPRDTSVEVGPEFVAEWIEHIQDRVPDQVHYYALDNEPSLWPYTHRDVHPQMTTYDEIWDYSKAYGEAIKEADPKGQIFGPVSWGWCDYFYSAADGCSAGADSAAHGGKPFLEWYLSQAEAYRNETSVRLIDYLDIHYYPTESGVAISEDESKGTAARRLKSLKALYDPTFKDASSWIGEPVNLIPRMKDIIERNAPGTKLAITEYNFGNGRGISSGLAQAEALAIFGREGVDLATRWGQPLENTPIEDAFKLYLNYDGKGSRINGDSVRATSSNADMVGSYAISGADGELYVLLFNKDTAPKEVSVSIAGRGATQGEVYRFDADDRLKREGSVDVSDMNSFAVETPARSATLIVFKS